MTVINGLIQHWPTDRLIANEITLCCL